MAIIVIIVTIIFLLVYICAIKIISGLNWLDIEIIFAGISSLTFMLISSLLIDTYEGGILTVGSVSI